MATLEPTDKMIEAVAGYRLTEEVRDYAYVRRVQHDETDSTFIRIVRPGEVDSETIDSWSVYNEEADVVVDLDADGNIIGVTITTFKRKPNE